MEDSQIELEIQKRREELTDLYRALESTIRIKRALESLEKSQFDVQGISLETLGVNEIYIPNEKLKEILGEALLEKTKLIEKILSPELKEGVE